MPYVMPITLPRVLDGCCTPEVVEPPRTASYGLSMSTGPNDPETEEVEADDAADADVEPDTQSDPAHDDSSSTEWASEGGAPTEGPATDTDDG